MGESHLSYNSTYDTLLAINVIEHVQSGFHYLKSLHKKLKINGTLIIHERYYDNPIIGDLVLGRNFYHPIRLKKNVFDVFLKRFQIIYSNYDPITAYKERNALEQAFWIIAKKKEE